MPVLSNPRHELFAQELAKGKTATEAYVLAGYKDNDSNACQLAKKVQHRVTEINGTVASKVENKLAINKTYVLTRLIENLDRAMQAEAVKDKDGLTGEYKYDGSVANRALELIGRELGMFIERKEIGQPGDFASMRDDELLDKIKEQAVTLGVTVPKHLHS